MDSSVDMRDGKWYDSVRHLNGEVSERFMELVLKTSDPKGPGVRIPLSPPFFRLIISEYYLLFCHCWRSTQVAEGAPLLRE